MKIYHLFLNEVEYADKGRTVETRKETHLVETHRTFEGARNSATSAGFNMSNLKKNVLSDEITSWPGYIREKGLRDEWMEIVEDTLMD